MRGGRVSRLREELGCAVVEDFGREIGKVRARQRYMKIVLVGAQIKDQRRFATAGVRSGDWSDLLLLSHVQEVDT